MHQLTDMQLSFALLVFTIWVNVDISLCLNACEALPEVPNAHIEDSSRKEHYTEGSRIYFQCDTGYISGLSIFYVCSNQEWMKIRNGICTLKPCELPEDIPNSSYQIIHGQDLLYGTIIKYSCNPGYRMVNRADTRICMLNAWSNHVPICEPVTCPLPNENGDLRVEGLPENDRPILSDRFLKFSCVDPWKQLNGSSMLICGKNGEWSHPFPSCEAPRFCGDPPHIANGRGQSPMRDQYEVGYKFEYTCRRGFEFNGETHVTCINGQWVGEVVCQGHNSCDEPPPLENGDFLGSLKSQYNNGDKIQYTCSRFYVLEGTPTKTCQNGQWVGDTKCLKPCTVAIGQMAKNNIHFRYSHATKLYSTHNDLIQFSCSRGVPDGSLDMTQHCNDGVMLLPRCH